MKPLRLVVLGTLASCPYAGHAWVHMNMAVGLRLLGHDVYYIEATSAWPYDPIRQSFVNDANYALPYLRRVVDSFGLGDRWAYRRSYSDKEWFGLSRKKAEELLAHADAVFNISGATDLAKEELKVGRLVYYGTDPVYHEIAFAQGKEDTRAYIEQHHDIVTIGENIGLPGCPIPPLPRLRARTRQPVLLDLWQGSLPSKTAFTTVGNWKQDERGIDYQGETYYWSKHHSFLKFLDVPLKIGQPLELAMYLAALKPETLRLFASKGWRLADAQVLSSDPWQYREYIQASRGEFTVAKDQYVRLRSGWSLQRELTAGDVVLLVAYVAMLYKPLEMLTSIAAEIQGAAAGAQRVFTLLDTAPDIADARDAIELADRANGHLVFEQVSFRYQGRECTLHNVNLDLPAGATVALVGPSGAGKSTLASLLLRFYDPTGGRITLDGIDLRKLTVKSLRRNIALVSQETVVFAASIQENIAYARPEATREEIEAAARAAGAHEFITALPQGYATEIGERGMTLSGGQRQRLAIARAFLKDAPILILDEPTSSLDAGTETLVLEALERLRKDRTTLIIAHRFSTIRSADQIIVLQDGRIVEVGNLVELRLKGGPFQRLYERQWVATAQDRSSSHRGS